MWKQGSLVTLTDGTIARFLFYQMGMGYHVLVHGRERIVHDVGRRIW